MAVYCVHITGACFIGLIFILLGIRQCKSESPVTATIIWIMAVMAELIGLTANHNRLERIYRKYL